MNKSLLSIVIKIVNEQGENILNEPARLKPYVINYASAEPKEDRVAFGRAIEQGFYQELKQASPKDKVHTKFKMITQLQKLTGLDASRCTSAIDLLDTILTQLQLPQIPQVRQQINQENPMQTHSQQPQVQPQVQKTTGLSSANFATNILSKISRRTLLFAIIAAIGALIGELVSTNLGLFGRNNFVSYIKLVVNVGLWAGLIGLGISVGLIITQTVYLKKKLVIEKIFTSALMGIFVGMISGAVAQIIFGFTSNISTLVEIISRVLCWGILGWGLGLGVSLYIPNYSKVKAMLAGLIGGIIGGAIFRAIIEVSPDTIGRVISITIMGFIIGLFISFVEEVFRQAWITVVWGPKEMRTIALGEKKIIFGSANNADVFLKNSMPIHATIGIENGQVVFVDNSNNKHIVLNNGETIMVDKMQVKINTKK